MPLQYIIYSMFLIIYIMQQLDIPKIEPINVIKTI